MPSCLQTDLKAARCIHLSSDPARVRSIRWQARSANRQHYGNHENANKSKGPNTGSGLW